MPLHVDIKILDLSLNPLLSSWETVAEVTAQLDHLHTLNLRLDRMHWYVGT